MFNVPIKLTTSVIPAFLLTVGVCDAVHILAIFYRHFELNADKEEAIVYAFRHSGLAIVLTSLTTIAALLSFSSAELSAIAEIGYFASAGVLLALVYTIVMLPAILALLPLKSIPAKNIRLSFMDTILLSVADFTTTQRHKILCVSIAIVTIFLPAIFQLEFSHDVVRYFPDSMPYRQDIRFIDSELGGTITLEIILDTGRKNGIAEPRLLNQIELICRKLEKTNRDDISVGKVFCITDILKEIHRALNENSDVYYRIPQNRNVIAQEFLLFENSGSDDLEKIVDRHFEKTRITLKTPWVDAVVGKNFVRDISIQLKEHFKDEGVIQTTGLMVLLARAISAAIYSMAKSYLIAFAAITLIMIFMLGNVKLGLLSMIPNLIPICFTMGMISLFKVPLDINSLMIGSIAIGIVVDDTVHFLYNFQKYYNQNGDPSYAVRETLNGVGRALLVTSLVLSAGFFIALCSSLKHLANFGIFTGITILIAFLADFVLMPAIMIMIIPRRRTTDSIAKN
jgi:predicted RND superfamily exporter protein